MATIRDLADEGVVALINHIKCNGAQPMTYSEFAKMIGWFGKDGRPATRSGKVLGRIGDDLRNFDPNAPRITVLVQSNGLASDGFRYFEPRWASMSKDEKERFTEKEKTTIER